MLQLIVGLAFGFVIGVFVMGVVTIVLEISPFPNPDEKEIVNSGKLRQERGSP